MKILIYGVTVRHGLPLAVALRVYGRHSVVGLELEPAPPGGHPNPEIRQLELSGHHVPIAPTVDAAVREGDALAILALAAPRQQEALDALQQTWERHRVEPGHRLPVIVVNEPHPNLDDHPEHLIVGYAPFSFGPQTVLDRLLNLSGITIARHRNHHIGTLRMAVSNAWRWVDNRIPITELPSKERTPSA